MMKYWFKYFHTGPDIAKVSVVPDSEDEIEMKLKISWKWGIFVASEAVWRLLEFDVSGRNQ